MAEQVEFKYEELGPLDLKTTDTTALSCKIKSSEYWVISFRL